MKTIIVLAVVVAFALGAPQAVDDSRNAQILRYETDNIGVDGYRYAFETSDGISRQEEAELKNAGTENEAFRSRLLQLGGLPMVRPTPSTSLLMRMVTNPKVLTCPKPKVCQCRERATKPPNIALNAT
uniref:Uncharacterized protein n=1 Tax=Lutzomyia longipalpis TaxID=7200 RepID=A0A1B0CLL2_LUTLO